MPTRSRNTNYDENRNKMLRLNLNNNRIRIEDVKNQLLMDYLGGRGLGVKILFDEVSPKVKPLSKDNKLIFAAGPLTGTPTPTGCRYEVVTKSPLTDTITGANAGGYFGTFLRQSGFIAILIEGCSSNPVYLSIIDGVPEVMSAHECWGANTHDTTDWITSELGRKNVSVACIGPAGENLVRYASIINDKHRASGRGGVGAVMGSKLLKAVAITGGKKIKLKIEKKFNNIIKKIRKNIRTKTITKINLPEYGTAKILDSANNYKLLGTRNFQQNHFEHAKKINAEQLKNKLLVKRNTCSGCPIGCKRVTKVGNKIGEGPEFETLWAFGAQCGVKNLNAIAKTNYLCNELGLDTISTGNTIGCAMELSEKGHIDEKISFGDARIIQKLTKQIAYRDGIGNNLAEGSQRFSSSVGYPELSMSVKSLELPAYDPRIAQTQGLGYATSTRGGCHVRAFVVKSDMVAGPQKIDLESIKEKVRRVIESQNKMAVVDSLGMCMFSTYVCDLSDYRGLLDSAVGVNFTTDQELLRSGERIWNLERLFNNKAGFSDRDDTLPARFTTEPVKDDLDFEHVWPGKEFIEDYYKERGWTEDGVPRVSKLRELGID